MKGRNYYCLLLLITAVILHCGFSGYAQTFAPGFVPEGCSPMLGQFKGPAGYWDFGDGKFVSTGSDAGGGHLYGPGEYVIRFKDTPAGTITNVGTIRVNASPSANFGTNGVTSGCVPLTINFEDLTVAPSGSVIVKRIWDFGPTGKESESPVSAYTYTVPGTYTVKLIVETNKGCNSVLEKTNLLVITKAPTLNFSVSKNKACGPFLTELTNTSTGVAAKAIYSWKVYDPHGDTVAVSYASAKPNFICYLSGSYKIRLTVKDPSGCQPSLEKSVAVVIAPNSLKTPGFSYTLTPSSGTCSSVNGEFTSLWQNSNPAGQTVDWEIEDPSGMVTKRNNLPNLTGNNKVVFATAGQWKVRVKASGGTYGCPPSGPFEQPISIVLGQAIAAFTLQDSVSCQLPHTVKFDASGSKNTVKYEWDFDNNGSVDATGVTASRIYTTYGNKDVRLIATDANGCKTESIKKGNIRLAAITAKFGADQTNGCNDTQGDFVVHFMDSTATASLITTWKWEFFDASNKLVGSVEGSDPMVHKNPDFKFHTTASESKAAFWVRLTVSNANGCTSTYTSQTDYIQVGNKPVASFTATPRYGCPNTRVDFTYTGSQPYDSLHWFPVGYDGRRITRKASDGPDYFYMYNEEPGTYVAGLIVWNGTCSAATSYKVGNPSDPRFQQVAPKANASWRWELCQQSSITFTDLSKEAQYWRWDFGSTAVANPYPSGKSIREYASGSVPDELRNPVVDYPPGAYTAILHVEADNVVYVADTETGELLKNRLFQTTGQKTTYTNNANGAPLWSGSLTTGDSVLFIRCSDEIRMEIKVPDFSTQDATFSSNYDPTQPNCFPVTVNFSNNTPGVFAWNWILGNGQTSTEQNPTGIVYKEPGKYTVELEVTTLTCQYRKTYPGYIQVNGVVANFDCSKPEGCIGESMFFRDLSAKPESIRYRTWTMGNGVIFSNDPSVSGTSAPPGGASTDLSSFDYIYPTVLPLPALQADSIPVTLTVTETTGCKSSKTIKVRPTMPQPDFDIAMAAVSCDEQTVTVTVKNPTQKGLTPFRYTWQAFKKGTTSPVIASFGPDGTASRTFRLKAQSPTEAQEYDIRLQLEDAKYQTGTGCKAEITKTVTVKPYVYKIDFTYDQPGICPPFKVQFYDHSEPPADIAAWDWNFGDGSPHSTVQHPLKIYQKPNLKGYTISLTVTFKNGCKKTYVHPIPIIINGILGTFTIREVAGSPGKLPAPVLSNGATVDYVKGPFTPDEYTVQFDAVVDPEDLPKIGYYIWDFDNGTEVTTSATITHTYSQPGVYAPRLVIVNKQECRYEAPADLHVVANTCEAPEIAALPKKCRGETITLSGTPSPKATGKLKVTWTNLTDGIEIYHGTGLTAVTPVDLVTTKAMNVMLTVTDEGGCTSSDVKSIELYPQLMAEAGPAQEVCAGSPVTLAGSAQNGSGSYTFAWTSPDGVMKTGSTPTFTNLTVGEHLLRLLATDKATQCTAADSVMIKVNPPVVAKANDNAEVCSGGSTRLSAAATGGTGQYTYQWTAGTDSDGLPSPMNALKSAQAPSTIFQLVNPTATNKTYTYYVTATDDIHCASATDEVRVTVTPDLTITLNDPGIICNGKSTQLTGTVVGGTGNPANWSYRWSKVSGNGNPAEIVDATAFHPTVTPTDLVTTYRLEVMETVNGQQRCSGSKEITVRLSTLIVVNIDPVPPQCFGTTNIPLAAHVTGGSGDYSYEWINSSSLNGTLRDADKSIAYISKIVESAEYTLIVKDKKAIDPICPVEVKVKVTSIRSVADAGLPQNACLGKSTRLLGSGLNGNAPYKFTWKIVSRPPVPVGGDADGLKNADVTASMSSPEFLLNNPLGTYVYALTVEDKGGCVSTNLSQVTIIVNPVLGPPSIAGKLEYCQRETISLSASGFPSGIFKWYTSSSLSPGALIYQGPAYGTPAVASTTYYVTQTNPLTGCESPAQVARVIVNKVTVPLVKFPGSYCPGEVIAPLVARRTSQGSLVRWYADIDLKRMLHQGDTLLTGLHSVPGATLFYVTQTLGGCEGPPVSVEVRVNPTPPAPVVLLPAPYCENEQIFPLTATGTRIKWYDDSSLSRKLAEGESFNTEGYRRMGKTTYYVTQSEGGCESPSVAVTIEVKPAPVKPQLEPVNICFEEEKVYELDAGAGYSLYKWEHNGATTQTVEISQEGTYFVNVTNEWACTVRDSIVVTELCPPRIFVPSAFTPNNDGKNDVMEIFGKHFYDLKLSISNRWGEVVYMGDEQSEPWDGRYRGEIVPAGTYTWVLRAKAKSDHSFIEKHGSITVIR